VQVALTPASTPTRNGRHMNLETEDLQKKENQSLSHAEAPKKSASASTSNFENNRPEAIAQRKLSDMANKSVSEDSVAQLKRMADKSTTKVGSVSTIQLRSYDPIQLAFHKDAASDAALFSRKDPKSVANPAIPKAATNLGVTELNMKHYLERHSYGYQRLSSKTIGNDATMFPQSMGGAEISAALVGCLSQFEAGDDITKGVEKDFGGIKYRMTSRGSGKLNGFFPISGHVYTASELDQMRGEKNKAK